MRRRALLLAAVAMLLAVGGVNWCRHRVPLAPPPNPSADGDGLTVTNALVGQTEAEIRAVYGAPDRDGRGYSRLGLAEPRSLPCGPVRTLIFDTRGGTLWVWVEQRGADWVCFESCWFADGVVF